MSILNRPLEPIDDDDLHRSALCLELQSELLLQRGEERWPVRIDRWPFDSGWWWSWRKLVGRRRKFQIDVVAAGEPGAIDDDAIRQLGDLADELCHRHPADQQLAEAAATPAQRPLAQRERRAGRRWPARSSIDRSAAAFDRPATALDRPTASPRQGCAVHRRLLHLRSQPAIASRQPQSEHRHFPCFRVSDHAESIAQQRPHHRHRSLRRRIEASERNVGIEAPFDVVVWRFQRHEALAANGGLDAAVVRAAVKRHRV